MLVKILFQYKYKYIILVQLMQILEKTVTTIGLRLTVNINHFFIDHVYSCITSIYACLDT